MTLSCQSTIGPGRQKKNGLRRVVWATVLAALPMMQGCAYIPDNGSGSAPVETTVYEAPKEDLNSLVYSPKFEPDYNNLTPQPWVEPTTKAQQDGVDVYPDRLEFPSTMTEVLGWQRGRVVVGAPSQGTGKNAMGFARRVVSVMQNASKIVVMTTVPAIEDLLQGNFQFQLKPEDAKPMDLTKADLDWVTNNLYYHNRDAVALPGEPLVDDVAENLNALKFWGDLGNSLSSAAKAVAAVAVDLYLAVTPATVSGSTGFDKTVKASSAAKLFGPLVYRKNITTAKGQGVKLSISGDGSYDAGLEFQQGLQLGAKIALPGHNANSEFWLNVDSRLYTKLQLKLDLEAAIEAALGETGSALQQSLDQASDVTQDILNATKKTFMGQDDVKPASSWKKTLYLTQPSLSYFQAGLVPVIVTSTFQVDLECGLEAKASIKTDLLWEQNATFKFSVRYEKGPGRTTYEGPTFDARKSFSLKLTGGGEVSVSCGLIPRINVLMYDSVGMFAGIRGSLVARAGYESQCKDDPLDFRPTGKVTLGLYGNVGLQIGARLQAPGSSYAGTAGQAAGYDFGPIEPWNREFKLAEKQWTFAKGLGYCTPTCKNGKKDEKEPDIDCGSVCGKCQIGQKCQRSSECSNSVCNAGVCSTNKCGDQDADGLETDVDCGGPTMECATRCAVGKRCQRGTDCASGFCGGMGRCVSDHCQDGAQNGDEGGFDCGGARCAKCPNNYKVTGPTHCASGLWNGVSCVGAICDDGIKSGDETGQDCGGATCAARCGYQDGCRVSSDCSAAAPICNTTRKICLRGAGMACQSDADCGTGTCTNNVCAVPTWKAQNSDNTFPLQCVGGAGPNNVWTATGVGSIVYWNGTNWTGQASPVTTPLYGVWALNASNAYFVGPGGTILKWDGAMWSKLISGTMAVLKGVHGASANAVWVVGNGGTIRKWDGATWIDQSNVMMTKNLNAVWAADANNIWAVGAQGTIMRGNGTTWTAQTSGTMQDLYGVWGTSANNIWAVGSSGTIMKWDGAFWTAQTSGTNGTLNSVTGVDANNAWTVSGSGTILRWNGSAWNPENVENAGDFFSGVYAADLNNVWAVSGTPRIYKAP